MHELVVSYMIHGPYASLNSDCPCMNNAQKKCHFRYPRQFNETTLQGKDAYPVYQRRDNEASFFQFPTALRRLLASILVFCELGDVHNLWNDDYNVLSEDYRRQYGSIKRVQNMVLTDIMVFLQPMGDDINEFDIPKIDQNVDLEFGVFYEKFAYDEIMRHVDNDILGVFFIDGPGGTGKTFLYKALLVNIHSCGHIALATASAGVVANNMSGGEQLTLALKFSSILKIIRSAGFQDKVALLNCFGLQSDGVEETVHKNFIRIPDDMVIPFNEKENSLNSLIDAIFPSLEIN
ncbi:unnamed protein product [Lactuca saligna]|uniref:ATP-dependent DNA helicase n=1 Tax=Lactuca saligna TaxID=75948 RepID=A0AA35YQ31_LACSI|nr:unnamed protein product [Lactuca saligna]